MKNCCECLEPNCPETVARTHTGKHNPNCWRERSKEWQCLAPPRPPPLFYTLQSKVETVCEWHEIHGVILGEREKAKREGRGGGGKTPGSGCEVKNDGQRLLVARWVQASQFIVNHQLSNHDGICDIHTAVPACDPRIPERRKAIGRQSGRLCQGRSRPRHRDHSPQTDFSL